MKHNFMVDVETLGTQPDAVILSIGAVAFDHNKIVNNHFYMDVDPNSCVEYGLTIDANTVKWWLGQSDEARKAITEAKNPETLYTVLLRLSDYMLEFTHSPKDVIVWGNGATFDNVILASAYSNVGLPKPWGYRGDRCYRTVKASFPDIPFVRTGCAHHALDDARSQAQHLMAIAEKYPDIITQ